MTAASSAAVRFGPRIIGPVASVAGVITRLDTLLRVAQAPGDFPCHLLELRLGELPCDSDWIAPCRRARAAGRPVLATLRNRAEGGVWTDDDPARLRAFGVALAECDAVDVEWRSALRPEVLRLAEQANKPVVCSLHDFQRTPPAEDLLGHARAMAAATGRVVKIALKANTAEDIATLRAVLGDPFPAPRCVIGMGELAADTRVAFAREGSCLTYGWLDAPTAPGQPSCAELMRQLG